MRSGLRSRPGGHHRRRLSTPALAIAAFIAGVVLAGGGGAWASHQFSDVPTSSQFHDDIDWMVDNGITNGYADGTFKPTAAVSRQAFSAFLHRYSDTIEYRSTSDSPSVAAPAYYREVTCPTGKRAISGGGFIVTQGFLMQANAPTADGRGWRVLWVHRSGGNVLPGGVGVVAVCAPA